MPLGGRSTAAPLHLPGIRRIGEAVELAFTIPPKSLATGAYTLELRASSGLSFMRARDGSLTQAIPRRQRKSIFVPNKL